MELRTFDWRDDPMGTVIAAPQVRARFMRFEPGRAPAGFHTHEESGGVEIFLVLEGAIKFEVDGGEVVATAGQAVVAYPHQRHRASCVGDVPAILYLTVTPHRQPTHTYYDAGGVREPSRPSGGDYRWQGQPALGEAPA